MDVILREDVEKLGTRGQLVKVANGYARNFLLPKRLAVAATESNKKIVEQERQAHLRKEAKVEAEAADLAKLMAAVGTMAGWQDWFGIFIVTAVVGGVMAVIFALSRRRLKTTFWNVGFILTELKSGRAPYLKKEELDVRHPKSVGLPHAAVIAVGTLVFLGLTAFGA